MFAQVSLVNRVVHPMLSVRFRVFGVVKQPVYYFIVSLLVLFLVCHVTCSGACDWRADTLSLFYYYLMGKTVLIVDLCGSVVVGFVWQLLRLHAEMTAGRRCSAPRSAPPDPPVFFPPHRPPRRSVPAPAAAHTTSHINKMNSQETCRRVFGTSSWPLYLYALQTPSTPLLPDFNQSICCGMQLKSADVRQLEPFKLFPVTKETRQLLIQVGLDPNFKSQFNCISSALLFCLVVEASIL